MAPIHIGSLHSFQQNINLSSFLLRLLTAEKVNNFPKVYLRKGTYQEIKGKKAVLLVPSYCPQTQVEFGVQQFSVELSERDLIFLLK